MLTKENIEDVQQLLLAEIGDRHIELVLSLEQK